MKQLVSLSLLLLLSCSGRSNLSHDDLRPVKSAIAEANEYHERNFAGMATPLNAVNLAFKISGQILNIPITTGDYVSKGELLIDLDPRDIELQISADRSAYEQSLSQLNRAKRLLEREAVSRQEYENALTTYTQAEATYENSRETLSQTSMLSPFDAVVEAVYVDTYERVASGQKIVRIVEPYTTTVSFSVPESGLVSIADSTTRFSVQFDNYPNAEFSATIKEYALTSSSASLFPVSLTIDNPDPSKYKISPGFSCTISMMSEVATQGVVSIPLSAIYAPAVGGTYVWVVDSSNRVKRKPVVISALSGSDGVAIESGVESGERVVTAGVYQLTEGQSVKLLK